MDLPFRTKFHSLLGNVNSCYKWNKYHLRFKLIQMVFLVGLKQKTFTVCLHVPGYVCLHLYLNIQIYTPNQMKCYSFLLSIIIPSALFFYPFLVKRMTFVASSVGEMMVNRLVNFPVESQDTKTSLNKNFIFPSSPTQDHLKLHSF